jgi:hypothetical protein
MGVAWYRESDWPRVKELFVDAEELHETYAEWLESAESVVRHLEQHGVAVSRYPMDLDHFVGWCVVRDYSLDSEARSEYVAAMLELGTK